jgi:hypothetical protein
MMLHPQTTLESIYTSRKRTTINGSLTRRNETYAVDAPEQPTNSPNQIARLYVARCKLGGFLKIGQVCHSALLLQTKDNKYYILEYGVDSKHVVACYEIGIQHPNSTTIWFNGTRWSKQRIGEELPTCQTIESVTDVMERVVAQKNDYNITNWNCHMAQENTRRSLGLKVRNPYKPIYGNVGISIQLGL